MNAASADNLLLFALVLFVVAACWRYGVGMVYETRILQRQKDKQKLKGEAEKLMLEAEKLEEEYNALRPQAERLRRDLAVVKRKVAELSRGRFIVMQQMGRPGDGRRCFVFELFFAPTVTGSGARATFDPRFWNHRNFIEVWAQDARHASRLLTLTFDARSGFRRSALIEERANAG